MKRIFATLPALLASGFLVSCMQVGEPIVAPPDGSDPSNGSATPEEVEVSPTEALDRVYHEVLVLLFPETGGGEFQAVQFSQQASAGCESILEDPPDSYEDIPVPPSVAEFAGGFVAELEAVREEGFTAENVVMVMELTDEIVRIYDENILAVREEIPAACDQILTATGGHYFLPDTGHEFATRVLRTANDLELITDPEHSVMIALLPDP